MENDSNVDDEARKVEIDRSSKRLLYKVSDRPRITSTLFFAFQNTLLALPWNLTATILIAQVTCAEDDAVLKAKLLSTAVFVGGITTLAQCTIGIRLPLYQCPTVAYIIPLLALKSLDEWKCPAFNQISVGNDTFDNKNMLSNATDTEYYRHMVILPRIQLMKGSLILTGGIHALTGLVGFAGFLMRFIGPITVIPTILLMGLSIYTIITDFCAMHWGISITTMVISIILSLYLDDWLMPVPAWTYDKGFHVVKYPLQQVLSMLFAILIGWALAAILTETGLITEDKTKTGYKARTDARSYVVSETRWFYFPYPGQFGGIHFHPGLFVAFLTATFTSIIDSIADYYACARISRVPPPPLHAVNRGIAIEGLMCSVSGFLGTGVGTSTHGGHIGSIGITRVASVFVYQIFAVMLILFAIVGKLAAVFITIPYPVLGGVQILGFGMFIGLVLSNLQYIDMKSTRNLAIIGISVLFGLMIPYWAKGQKEILKTGNHGMDGFVQMLLTNPYLAGGILACFLDNTVPGTDLERGLVGWGVVSTTKDIDDKGLDFEDDDKIYDIQFIAKAIQNIRCLSYVPFLPTYNKKHQKDQCDEDYDTENIFAENIKKDT